MVYGVSNITVFNILTYNVQFYSFELFFIILDSDVIWLCSGNKCKPFHYRCPMDSSKVLYYFIIVYCSILSFCVYIYIYSIYVLMLPKYRIS